METSQIQQQPDDSFHEDNNTLPSVLVIGTDAGVLTRGSEHRTRMCTYAENMRELHIVVLGARGDHADMIKISDKVFVYPTHEQSRAKAVFEGLRISRRIVKAHHIDIISTQDPFETALVGYLTKWHSKGTKFNIQEHGDFFYQPYWRNERILHRVRYHLGHFLIHRADCIRVVSERIRQKFIAHGINADCIASVPVRTDTKLFAEAKPNPKILAIKPEGGVVILTIARFVSQKNLRMLINAFSQLVTVGVPARLVIVGEGPEKEELQMLAEKVAPHKIIFLPWTDDAAGYIQAADIYALSSNYEGWGRVCIEALATGTPIVMTDVGCAGEVVQNGVSGIVVPVGDEVALTEALGQLVTDAGLCTTLATKGKETVAHMPTQEEYRALYKKSMQCCMTT